MAHIISHSTQQETITGRVEKQMFHILERGV